MPNASAEPADLHSDTFHPAALARELLQDFLDANYQVHTDAGCVELRVGLPLAPPFSTLEGANVCALLTACNPGARAISASANAARMTRLDTAIEALGLAAWPARNSAGDGTWCEPSRLILDAGLAQVDALARSFGQLAVLVIGADSIVRMRFYCDPPAQSDVDTRFVDFVPCATANGSDMNESIDPAESPLLNARDICFRRGEERIFGPLSFTLDRGGVLVIEGGNGAGKTSLLRVLAGLLPATDGDGDDTATRLVRNGSVALLGHSLGLTGELDAVENLRFAAGIHHDAGGLGPRNALRSVGLEGYEDIAVARLSAGQRKRVALARLLVAPAAVWLLDEPYANLDPEGIALVNRLIERHTHGGGAAVLTSHGAQLPLRQTATRLRL